MLKRLFGRQPKTYQVKVEPFGQTLTVGARETILQAALRGGLAYPSECQTGACGSCKTLLEDGDIKALTDFAYVLELDEMREGYILACQSLARGDLKIRVTTLDDGLPVIAPVQCTGAVTSITPLTRDIMEIVVNINQPITYYAGQYANLTVPGIDGSRAYSFAAAPVDGGNTELVFHVRVIPDGELSGWLVAGNRIGAEISVEGPFGIFRLRDADVPIVCIAGGSGMAPIKAIIEQAGAAGVERPLVYLYGARTAEDLYPEALVDALTARWKGNIRFVPVLSEEADGSAWSGARGFVTDFIRSIDEFELAGSHAYLCGPPAMIDAAVPILTNAGVRGRDIYYDKFTDRSHLQAP